MKYIIAILILSLVVLIHELGHCLLAKANHITVKEFSIGFGPRLISFVRGETRYSLKLLPFGGSCLMAGQFDEEEEAEEEGSFNKASVGRRISVIAAGPVFNFILAFFAAIIVIGLAGSDPAKVVEVQEGSPAMEAGLQEGDLIIRYEGGTISSGHELYNVMSLEGVPTDTITLTYKRNGKNHKITYVPETTTKWMLGYYYEPDADHVEVTGFVNGSAVEAAGLVAGDVITGINGYAVNTPESINTYFEEYPLDGEVIELTYERNGKQHTVSVTPNFTKTASLGFAYNLMRESLSPLATLKAGFDEMLSYIRLTVKALVKLFREGFSVKELSGPVGAVTAISDVYEEAEADGAFYVFLNMLNMIILLSANLGVVNLFPFPALDGGKLVFLLIEAACGKPVPKNVEGVIHFAGVILLLILMVSVIFSDISKLL